MSNKNTKITYYSPKWISRRLDDVIDSTILIVSCQLHLSAQYLSYIICIELISGVETDSFLGL